MDEGHRPKWRGFTSVSLTTFIPDGKKYQILPLFLGGSQKFSSSLLPSYFARIPGLRETELHRRLFFLRRLSEPEGPPWELGKHEDRLKNLKRMVVFLRFCQKMVVFLRFSLPFWAKLFFLGPERNDGRSPSSGAEKSLSGGFWRAKGWYKEGLPVERWCEKAWRKRMFDSFLTTFKKGYHCLSWLLFAKVSLSRRLQRWRHGWHTAIVEERQDQGSHSTAQAWLVLALVGDLFGSFVQCFHIAKTSVWWSFVGGNTLGLTTLALLILGSFFDLGFLEGRWRPSSLSLLLQKKRVNAVGEVPSPRKGERTASQTMLLPEALKY